MKLYEFKKENIDSRIKTKTNKDKYNKVVHIFMIFTMSVGRLLQ